jgi:hypothetical protein
MRHEESFIQAQIVQLLSLRRIFAFSVPNELLGGARGAARKMTLFRALGLRSGVSDLVVVLPGKILFLEIKTPTGKQSESQKVFQSMVESLGHQYAIARSVEDVIKLLDAFQM